MERAFCMNCAGGLSFANQFGGMKRFYARKRIFSGFFSAAPERSSSGRLHLPCKPEQSGLKKTIAVLWYCFRDLCIIHNIT